MEKEGRLEEGEESRTEEEGGARRGWPAAIRGRTEEEGGTESSEEEGLTEAQREEG